MEKVRPLAEMSSLEEQIWAAAYIQQLTNPPIPDGPWHKPIPCQNIVYHDHRPTEYKVEDAIQTANSTVEDFRSVQNPVCRDCSKDLDEDNSMNGYCLRCHEKIQNL